MDASESSGKLPSTVAGAGVERLMWRRIFSSVAVALWVVNTLAAATNCLGRCARSSATSMTARYTDTPRLPRRKRPLRKLSNTSRLIGWPSAPFTPVVTTSRYRVC